MRVTIVGIVGLVLVLFACTIIGIEFFTRVHSPSFITIVREFASQIIAVGAIFIGLYTYLKSRGY